MGCTIVEIEVWRRREREDDFSYFLCSNGVQAHPCFFITFIFTVCLYLERRVFQVVIYRHRAVYCCPTCNCVCLLYLLIRALASARGSVATRRVATGPRARRARGQGHGHSRARRAREWPKHASPRARRARGRAKLSARLGACQCYYMFFTTQLKIAKFMGRSQDLNVG